MTEDAELQRLRQRLSELEPFAGAENLLARLRHDLNNPIAAIAGLTELLMVRETGLSEDGRRRLKLIQSTCERMGETVRLASFREIEAIPASSSSGPAGACRP